MTLTIKKGDNMEYIKDKEYNEYIDRLAAEYKEENEFIDKYDACNEWAEC